MTPQPVPFPVRTACQVGITTDPRRRRSEWERKYPRLYNWTILSTTYRTKAAAQFAENVEAAKHGCNHAAGGDDPEHDATWYVYRFTYVTT